MKEKLTQEIKDIFQQSSNWVKLEVEYAKFTVAEKVTMLISAMIIGAVCLLLGISVLLMLSFALVELFKDFMNPALAYVSASGAIVVIMVIIYLLRKPLLLNPIAKYLTRVFFSHKQ